MRIVDLESPLAGFHMRINLQIDKAFMYGTFEPALCRVIRERVKPGWTCWDIGANAGYFSLLLSSQVGARGSVYAFEPLPAIFSTLQENITLNRLDSIVHCACLALSDSSGFQELSFRSEALTGGGSLVSSNPAGLNAEIIKTRVRAQSGDDYWAALNSASRVAFIKIDVEGAEGLVIRGLRNTIQADHPLIAMEVHPGEDSTAAQARHLLSQFGYHLAMIDDIHILAE